MMAGSKMRILAGLVLVMCMGDVLGAHKEVTVGDSKGLLKAFMDFNVAVIKISGDFRLEREHWPGDLSGEMHLAISRDLVLMPAKSAKRPPKIDMGFMEHRVLVADGHTLSIKNLYFVHNADFRERRWKYEHQKRNSLILPFFCAEGSGYLMLRNVTTEAIDVEDGRWALVNTPGNSLIASTVGSKECEARGVKCPRGAMDINGTVPIPGTNNVQSTEVILHSLQIRLPYWSRKDEHNSLDASVEGSLDFHKALQNPMIRWIFLVGDVLFDTDGWPDGLGDMKSVLELSHKVSIVTHPWFRPQKKNPAVMDLNFKTKKIIVKEKGALEIKGITLLRTSYTGPETMGGLDFFGLHSGGSLLLQDTIVEVVTTTAIIAATRQYVNKSASKGHLELLDCASITPLFASKRGVCEIGVSIRGQLKEVSKELPNILGYNTEKILGSLEMDMVVLALGNEEHRDTAEEEALRDGVRVVSSESELYDAMKYPKISLIHLVRNLNLTEEVWGGAKEPPMVLNRSLTLASHPQSLTVVLNFGGLQQRVQVQEGNELMLKRLDLDTMDISFTEPNIDIPFVSLKKGGALILTNILAFVSVEAQFRLHSGRLIPAAGEHSKMQIVSNNVCKRLADLTCPLNALHVVKWASADFSRNAVAGKVTVSNMLLVAVRRQEVVERFEIEVNQKRVSKVWGDAAIGLGVTAAIAVVCLVLGVVVALKKRQEQKSKTGQLQMSEGANYNSNGIGGNQADVYANSMVYEIGIPASSSVRKPEWLHSI